MRLATIVTCKLQVTIRRVNDATTMLPMTDAAPQSSLSPLDAALSRVGDRWSFLVVEALLDGPRRFNDLGSAIPGIAPNILTDRLRRLEREGVVVGRGWSSARAPCSRTHTTSDPRS